MHKIYRQLMGIDEITVQSIKVNKKDKKSQSSKSTETPALTTKTLSSNSPERPPLLLELSRLAADEGDLDLCYQCITAINSSSADQSTFTQVEFLHCYLMVKKLGEHEESYLKQAVETRMQAIERCHEALLNAIRQGDSDTIQSGCATQYNLCLPIVQVNLRKNVRKYLHLVAEASESISSLHFRMRCVVHFEIAKIESDFEQIPVAVEHLDKAAKFDDFNEYREAIAVLKKRLVLRAELYQEPERAEDRAAQMLEQAQSTNKSANVRMKRALLVQVGNILSPESFLQAMEAESTVNIPGDPTQMQLFSEKVSHFKHCIGKLDGHLKRIGNDNDRERARLWADLARTARKQEVWDVCRLASRYCLLYDDGRWKNPLPTTKPEPDNKKKQKMHQSLSAANPQPPLEDLEGDSDRNQRDSVDSRGSDAFLMDSSRSGPPPKANLYEKELLRMLAEVNFVNAESHIHLVRSMGIEIFERPLHPIDTRKLPKGHVKKNLDEDKHFNAYCDWIIDISKYSLDAFTRAAQLGVELNEAWIVTSAAAYVWNYSQHLLNIGRQRELVPTLQLILECLRKTGHDQHTELLVHICSILAYGLIQPWLPPVPKYTASHHPDDIEAVTQKKKPGSGKARPVAAQQITIDTEALPDCKKAAEVCVIGMEVTNGSKPEDVISIRHRYPLLQVWVQAKQMASQSIGKGFGCDVDAAEYDFLAKQMRACVAIEMLWLNRNGVMEFKEAPNIGDAAQMISDCEWDDTVVALQLWTKLAYISLELEEYGQAIKSVDQAVLINTNAKNNSEDASIKTVKNEIISLALSLKGQSLIRTMQGKIMIRRQAMSVFLQSVKYAQAAKHYAFIVSAARHYWNACIPLIGQTIERELLQEPLKIILHALTTTVDKKRIKKLFERPEDDDEVTLDVKERKLEQKVAVVQNTPEQVVLGLFPPNVVVPPSKEHLEEDLILRANMYSVVFQAYADKGMWQQGVNEMDDAVNSMPRTSHRLAIFKHRILTKAKLGQPVAMDIQKFKSEPEDKQAELWRVVALNSKHAKAQLEAYKNAIESITVPEHNWLKVDLLIEFCEWLYSNHFPMEVCNSQLEWALDILFNMVFEQPKLIEDHKKTKGGKGRTTKTLQQSEKNLSTSSIAPSSAANVSKSKSSLNKKGSSPEKTLKSTKGKADVDSKEEKLQEVQQEAIQFVPQEKPVIIGVTDINNTQLNISHLSDIRQLDSLFKVYCLQAKIMSGGHHLHKLAVLNASACVLQMWKISLAAAGPIVKEIAKNKAADGDHKGGKGGKNTQGKKDKEPGKEKLKRKGPLEMLPCSLEDWSTYDVPDEVVEAFRRHEAIQGHGLGTNNIRAPTITLFYLKQLVKHLREVSCSHLAFPALAMADYITRDPCKSRAANCVVHLLAQDVCLELNLTRGFDIHEVLTGPLELSQEDQAENRKMVILWKEKRAQVKIEEEKAQETLKELAKELKRDVSELQRPKSDEEKEELAGGHIGTFLVTLQRHLQWLEAAELLIDQGQYQLARSMLREVYFTAKEMEDPETKAKTLVQLAKLAFKEKQFGQAVQCAKQAQTIIGTKGSEEFWFQSTMILVEASANDYTNKQAQKIAKTEIIRCITVFNSLCKKRPNKSYLFTEYIGQLELLYGTIFMIEISDKLKNRIFTKKSAFKFLLKALSFLELSADKLTNSKCLTKSIDAFVQCSECYKLMSKLTFDLDDKHLYLCKAVHSLLAGVNYSQMSFEFVHDSCKLADLKNVSLPVDRLVAYIKLQLAETYLHMYDVYITEDREAKEAELQKDPLVKAVEDFTRDPSSNHTREQEAWQQLANTAFDVCMNHLQDAHSLSSHTIDLKTKALVLTGRCLRLQSLVINPDSPLQWIINNIDFAFSSKHDETPREDDEITAEESVDPLQGIPFNVVQKHAKQIKLDSVNSKRCQMYLAQATEVLHQALHLSLTNEFIDLCRDCSVELLECIGQFDVSQSTHFLSLYQSCRAAIKLRQLLALALRDPTVSEQAALINQLENLKQTSVLRNSLNGPIAKAIKELLNKIHSWRLTSIDQQYTELQKSMPSFFNVFILEHSKDGRFIYACGQDKAKLQATTKRGVQLPNRSFVVRAKVNSDELESILRELREFKIETTTFYVKHEYQRSQMARQRKMLEAITVSVEASENMDKAANLIQEEIKEDLVYLQEKFETILGRVNIYLNPVLKHFAKLNSPPSATNTSSKKATATKVEDSGQPNPAMITDDYVVLCVDSSLCEMPLEALHEFHYDNQVSLSRDFSLQLLHRRLFGTKTGEDGEILEGSKSKKSDKNKIPSRIPGLRDASRKQNKIIPLVRPVPQGCQPVDTSHFRYVVDPNLDCAETEPNKPIECFKEMIEKDNRIQQFTPRWLGIIGEEHPPSLGEYEIYMKDGTAFLFYGMERFVAEMPPHSIVSMSLSDNQLIGLFDLAHTSQSFLRQSKIDVAKRNDQLALEKPVETAMLLTLAGAHCLWSNQWSCSLEENGQRMETLLADILENGKTTGNAIGLLFEPHKRNKGMEETIPEEQPIEATTSQEQIGRQSVTGGSVRSTPMARQSVQSRSAVSQLGPDIQRCSHTMVLYGMPNVLVTLIDK